MISFPNGKINIGLQVIGKRADGYHDLQSVFIPVSLHDALEIIEIPRSTDLLFTATGIPVDENNTNNICIHAYDLLKKDFPQLPGISMHLHKAIPAGAGLGGGSADGAFALQLLNKNCSLNITEKQLHDYALRLGSDCPFFIQNKPCFVTGRGEGIEEITPDLSAYKILLINPRIHISTGKVFSLLKVTGEKNLKECIMKPIPSWPLHIFNDFEQPVFEMYPEIKSIKDNLYTAGAAYASMSGTGSSVYGLFKKESVTEVNFPAHYFYKWL